MRALSFILYFLPLFFYTLSIAPNYTENSILHALLSVSLVFGGALGFTERLVRKKFRQATLPLVGGITLSLLFAFLNHHQVELLILGVATLIFMLPGYRLGKFYTLMVAGLGLFLVSYLCITGFGFSQLLKVKILIFSLPALLLFSAYFRKSNWKWSPLLLLAGMSIALIYQDHYKYLAVFVGFLVPTIYFVRAGWGKKIWVEAITIISLIGFCVYYVLYATYLIEALRGGV